MALHVDKQNVVKRTVAFNAVAFDLGILHDDSTRGIGIKFGVNEADSCHLCMTNIA